MSKKDIYMQKKWASLRNNILLYLLLTFVIAADEVFGICILLCDILLSPTELLRSVLILLHILLAMSTRLCKTAYKRMTVQNNGEWAWRWCFDKNGFKMLKKQQLNDFEQEYIDSHLSPTPPGDAKQAGEE